METICVPEQSTARPRSSLRADTMAESVLVLLVMTIIQRGLGLCRGVLFCRWLSPEQLGQWDMALGFIDLAAPVAVLGLPGSFGRYVEFYRQRGQVKSYLRQSTLWTVVLALSAVAVMGWQRAWFAELVFGTAARQDVIGILACGLCAVIAYNFIISLLTAFRKSKLVSLLEFCNSVGFALFSLGLLWFWQAGAAGIVMAYCAACLVSSAVAGCWIRSAWRDLADGPSPLSHGALWSKVLPFAAWVWGTNWLSNMFELADRYMIVHYSGLSDSDALIQVGNYHSSRVVPFLLVTLSGLLGTMLMPYLSHDWETGRRGTVSDRMNLTIKLLGVALFAGAIAILLAAPLLFDIAFKGKYAGGRDVLPWTLTYCIWFGLARVAQKYLWCAEQVRLAAFAWFGGIALNIALNLLLLPRFGLLGVVLATASGNLVSLLLVNLFNHWLGMRTHWSAWLVLVMPATLCLGPWPALACLLLIGGVSIGTNLFLNHQEKQELLGVWNRYIEVH